MKHLLILISALAALLSPLSAHSAPRELSNLTVQALTAETLTPLDYIAMPEPADSGSGVRAAVGGLELAWLPVAPSPGWTERALCMVPPVALSSGYLTHRKRNERSRTGCSYPDLALAPRLSPRDPNRSRA